MVDGFTYEDPRGAERERLEDIGAAADASVEEHRDTSLGGRDHLLEGADGGWHVVELPGAVVGYDDARRAGVDGKPSCVPTETTIYVSTSTSWFKLRRFRDSLPSSAVMTPLTRMGMVVMLCSHLTSFQLRVRSICPATYDASPESLACAHTTKMRKK